ncbi:DUF1682-domain-containing protein [Patellaria atrata CBS 101060]|uniref:DUF1682-domain-containing protein n=1 Tax=Patellaria atrata CBS 101060 TaxID=1346257 RepID=A0A9P4VVI6_9PEZI|nr:DUF1682-domain-containing protein [Patellaria atrata CBS 101060]
MAEYLKNVFGGSKPSTAPVDDADFADYAGAPEPTPVAFTTNTAASPPTFPPPRATSRPYTKWYRVWERTQPRDFYQEAFIIPFILLIVLIHVWGTRANRRRAHGWIKAHAPTLQQEFAQVGFETPKRSDNDQVAHSDETVLPEMLLKEKTANEFTTYASGRQNIAFVDLKLTFVKRYNPMVRFGEAAIGFMFESLPATIERMEATAYAFDGKEKDLVGSLGGTSKLTGNSIYDAFVWAIVHKDMMKLLRDDRYDLSLTATKDHPKLPIWATVMSESAEITESLLTPELIQAVESAGHAFEALVISDQPMEQPKKLNETVPKKRVSLALKLPSSSSTSAYTRTLPIFQYFLRLTDTLVSHGRFRPEALRKVKATREEEMRKIKRVDEAEQSEERKQQADKAKKELRDQKLKNMSADEQRKYLEKEREKDMRRGQKRKTMKA